MCFWQMIFPAILKCLKRPVFWTACWHVVIQIWAFGVMDKFSIFAVLCCQNNSNNKKPLQNKIEEKYRNKGVIFLWFIFINLENKVFWGFWHCWHPTKSVLTVATWNLSGPKYIIAKEQIVNSGWTKTLGMILRMRKTNLYDIILQILTLLIATWETWNQEDGSNKKAVWPCFIMQNT